MFLCTYILLKAGSCVTFSVFFATRASIICIDSGTCDTIRVSLALAIRFFDISINRYTPIRYQHSYMIVERRTIPLWPNNDWQTELVSKELSCAYWTECIERDLKVLLLEAMGFVHNEDNDDLSSTHVTSKTCSVTPGEQIYLLSIFFTWMEKEQPSHCDITKADGLNWFLKEVPNTDPT